jgi:SAM-dependent methyltransferase
MLSREKIIATMRDIKAESDNIKPYVVILQPRRDKKEIPAQRLVGEESLHIDMSGYSHGFCDISGEKVDVARNYLLDCVLESGAKYALFVGEDTVFPRDGFRRLHETAEKNPDAMVVGVYYFKMGPPMIMVKNGDWIVPADVNPGKVFEALQTGLDAALIPISLLRKMKEAEPELPFCCIGYKIEDLPFVGEDNFFVYRLRKHGFKLLVNSDVQCLHVDLKTGKYTAHPSIKIEDYSTNIPLTGILTSKDKVDLDKRWIDGLPKGSQVCLPLDKKIALHVGCGTRNPESLHPSFRGAEWHEVRLDIDPQVQPDIVASVVNMDMFKDSSVDGVWSSHNLEHMAAHEVQPVLKECLRVLKPNGVFLLALPDIQAVCAAVVQKGIDAVLYESPAGPISAVDILYGHRASLALGREAMAHKTGFTVESLTKALSDAGFKDVLVERDNLALFASACKR